MIKIHTNEENFWLLVIIVINLQIIYDTTKFYFMEDRSKRLLRTYLQSYILTVLMTILIYLYIDKKCPFNIIYDMRLLKLFIRYCIQVFYFKYLFFFK